MSIRRQRGLTIIELVMFIIIMGVAAAGIIGVLNLGTKSSADPLRRKQAMLIAEAFMEEVQLAPFTLCVATDANVGTAVVNTDCASPAATVGGRAANAVRPYSHVTDYATAFDTEQRTFAKAGVDRDINDRALGQDANLKTMGNSSLGGITTTVTLSLLGAGGELGPTTGPANLRISSTAAPDNLNVLRITIITRYGTGDNDLIRLEGFRTRYAPQN